MKYWAIIFLCIALVAPFKFGMKGFKKLFPKVEKVKIPTASTNPQVSTSHHIPNRRKVEKVEKVKSPTASTKPHVSRSHHIPDRAQARKLAKVEQWMTHDNLFREAKIAKWTLNNAIDEAEKLFKIWRQNPNSLSAKKTFESALKYAELLKKHSLTIDGKLFESQKLLSKFQ